MSVTFPTIEISNPDHTPPGLHFITVKSPALKRRADISVFIPSGIKAGPLPLVTLLHGVYGSHWAWLFKAGAHEVLTRLIETEGLPAMALAMPSDGLWGDGSGYLRHNDADYRTWIVDEVPAAVALIDPNTTHAPHFLCGLSMGGYGALRIGSLHAERYTALSAHSSVTDAADLQTFILEGSGPFDLAEDQPLQAIACLKANAHRLPPFRLDCGTEDALIEPNRRLHHELERAGIPHDYQEFPGGHSWTYWRTHLADSLRFFARILNNTSPKPTNA
jgi:enterochelin esterase-like enzyme